MPKKGDRSVEKPIGAEPRSETSPFEAKAGNSEKDRIGQPRPTDKKA